MEIENIKIGDRILFCYTFSSFLKEGIVNEIWIEKNPYKEFIKIDKDWYDYSEIIVKAISHPKKKG